MSLPTTPVVPRRANIFAAMSQVTPTHGSSPPPANGSSSSPANRFSSPGPEGEQPPVETVLPVSIFSTGGRNATEAVERFAARHGLEPQQTADCVALLRDPFMVTLAKMFVLLYLLLNKVTIIVLAQPTFEPSEALLKNMKKYAMAIMFSPMQASYKKNGAPLRVLLNLLKIHRFDLPPNIEGNAADYAILKRAGQEIFTQIRSDIKKEIAGSLGYTYKHPKVKPLDKCKNIYTTTKAIVARSDSAVTVELCARVALMRQVWVETYKNPKADYWKEVDGFLAEIREKADGDDTQVARAFRELLTTDRQAYGTDNYTIVNGTADSIQAEVDTAVEKVAMDAAGDDCDAMDED
ncbi:hypothetical protein HMN09_00866400 [Mycena chlorophos]|uniref:Uncharacterized protein n=1 Tax=Mycena chlorophos TaxID=658473 RepID=A0A8H6W5B5_MYCCL|nr:hypothetical protein HMN09_00866400 [Mycena chlorophos]